MTIGINDKHISLSYIIIYIYFLYLEKNILIYRRSTTINY